MATPTQHEPLAAVVFDIGGVLLEWRPERVYADLLPDAAERAWFLANVCTAEWNGTLDAGRPFDDACRELARSFPRYEAAIHAWKRQDEMIAGEIAGTSEIADALGEAGVGRYLLTNMPADVFAARRQRYGVLARFDGAVVSGEEGVCKPDPEIFRRLLERFQLDPQRTLFVDDVAANVEAARALGLHGHVFRDAPSLAVALRRWGQPVPSGRGH